MPLSLVMKSNGVCVQNIRTSLVSTPNVILVLRVAAMMHPINCAVRRKPDLVSHRCQLLRM